MCCFIVKFLNFLFMYVIKGTVEIAGSRLSQLLVRPSYCIDM